MNSRDVVLVSTATICGALASALALRFFFSSKKPKLSEIHSSSTNGGAAAGKPPSQSPFDPSKRKWYLSWDDYFMAIAFLSAERSKDPNRQVGACLVSPNGVILDSIIFRGTTELNQVLPFQLCTSVVPTALAVAGIGYNGFPRGCSDDKLPWAKKSKNSDPLETKYPYVCHAEVNAILNTNHASAAGQRLYVTMFPCNECAKIIIQSGVSEVIYFVEKNSNNSDVAYAASRKLLSMANVKVRKLQPQMDQILIKFEDPL